MVKILLYMFAPSIAQAQSEENMRKSYEGATGSTESWGSTASLYSQALLLSFSLDNFADFNISYKTETIHIGPDEILSALKEGECPCCQPMKEPILDQGMQK
jgi:hypothetical protein